MLYSVDSLSGIVEEGLRSLQYPTTAPSLFDPIKYTLESGGKRLRPVLTLATYAALSGKEPQEVLNQAIAVELFHNFTLLHDDVMDNADIRRGRPTVHRKWNANVAILSGDAMLTFASQQLCKDAGDKLEALQNCFNTTAMEVYEGQQLDMEFETRMDVSVKEYMEMIRLKTSVLLGCACKLGAIMAGASDSDCAAFYEYGINLGLAFQMQDDWLDTYGDPAVFGKQIGGDIINRKKTWLLATALAEEFDDTSSVLAEDLEDSVLIEEITAIYERLNLSKRCSELASDFSTQATASLNNVEIPAVAADFFRTLAETASTRNH